MSIRHRIGKLERASGSGFRFAFPEQLDGDGNVFARPPRNDQVKGIHFTVDGQSIEVWREPEETYEELKAKSVEIAQEELNPTAFLHFDAKYL